MHNLIAQIDVLASAIHLTIFVAGIVFAAVGIRLILDLIRKG